MKNLLILLLVFTFLNLTAQHKVEKRLSDVLTAGLIINLGMNFYDFEELWNGDFQPADSRMLFNCYAILIPMAMWYDWPITVSTSFDPKIALLGSEVSPPTYNGKVKYSVRFNKWDIAQTYEYYSYVDYNAVGLTSNYEVLDLWILKLAPGVGGKIIYNQNKVKPTPEVNFEIRTAAWKQFYVSWQFNAYLRPELVSKTYTLDSHIMLNYKIE